MVKGFQKIYLPSLFILLKTILLKDIKLIYIMGHINLFVFFNDDLIRSINILKQKRTDENWDEQVADSNHIDNIIDNIVGYGEKEMAEIIMNEFDLNKTLNKMYKNGENIENE